MASKSRLNYYRVAERNPIMLTSVLVAVTVLHTVAVWWQTPLLYIVAF